MLLHIAEFLFIIRWNSIPPCVYTTLFFFFFHIVFIHSSVNGLLSCYCEYCYCEYCCFVHGNVNFSLDSDCSSLDQIPRVRIAGFHSSSIFFFFNFFE